MVRQPPHEAVKPRVVDAEAAQRQLQTLRHDLRRGVVDVEPIQIEVAQEWESEQERVEALEGIEGAFEDG